MAQILLHGVIEAKIMEADLSVTSDGRLRPTKKVSAFLLVHCLILMCISILTYCGCLKLQRLEI
jgi:phospholipase D1/2